MITAKCFHRTQISEIAEAAGRSAASFYNYNPNETGSRRLAEFRPDTPQRVQPAYRSATPVRESMRESPSADWMSYPRSTN